MSSDRIGLDQVLVGREVNEAELAAVAFMARYSGRTSEAYRQDLRFFFAWTGSVQSSRSMPACHCETSNSQHDMLIHARPPSTTADAKTATTTPHTSSSPSPMPSSPEHGSGQSARDGQTSKNEQRVPGAFASLASAVRSATSSVSARAT